MRGNREPRRVRTALGILGALVLAGLIAGGGAVSVLAVANASGATGRNADSTVRTAPSATASTSTDAASDAVGSDSPPPSADPSTVGASPSAPLPSAALSRSPFPDTTRRATTGSTPRASRPAAVRPRTKAPSAPGTGTAEQQVLNQINAARSAAGVGPLTMSSGLIASAHAHNLVMADGCGLSHQCDGEDGLGNRISTQGVDWSSVAENIGDGGPVDDSESAQAGMAVGLTRSMLAETPPDDGHRKNILNGSLHHIGIDVIRDSSGTVWLTQDFSN